MKYRVLSSVVLSSSLLFLYNNCGNGFQVTGDVSQLSILSEIDNEPWPEVVCSVSGSFKTQVEEETEERQRFPESIKSAQLTEDDNLLVTVNNECFKKFGPQSILTEKLENLTPDAVMTTFRYPIFEPISGLEVYREMLADSCIVEVDRDDQIKLFNAPPSDPQYSNQRYLASVNHAYAFAQGYNSNNGINQEVRVAVIDSGMDINHPDLRDMILRQSNGAVVGLNGINTSSTDYSDSGLHGTHVAGIVAAQAQNNQGISGTAGLYAKLMPVRASDDGQSISVSAITNGIRWAADKGAHVINMSLGGPSRVESWVEAIKYANSKGTFVVVAAGNDNEELGANFSTYPAMFTKEVTGMLTVGSFDASSKNRSGFSNYSNQYVDIMSPGSDGSFGILSTVPRNFVSSGYAAQLSGRPINGTSMASPVVAGAAAMVIGLAKSRGFDITPEQVKLFFTRGSVQNSSFSNFSIGGKMLDLKKLLDTVADDTGLPLSSNLDRSQVRGRIQIQDHSRSIGLPAGSPLELSVTKSSDSAILVKYEWLKNGQVIPGANQPRLVIRNTSLQDKGVYQARLSSGLTQKLTGPIKVNIANCSN